jgi:hypothetical protein
MEIDRELLMEDWLGVRLKLPRFERPVVPIPSCAFVIKTFVILGVLKCVGPSLPAAVRAYIPKELVS